MEQENLLVHSSARPAVRLPAWLKKLSFFDIILILFPVALLLKGPSDPDLGWHLRVGQDIWRGIFPFQDIYSWSMPGYAWVDHEWLANALMALAYRLGGPIGLSIPYMFLGFGGYLLAVRTGALISRHLPDGRPLASMAGWRLGLGLMTIGLIVNNEIIGMRAQVVTLFGFALAVYLLWSYLLGERRNAWLLVPLFWVWANMHAGFVIGLLTLGMTLGLLALAHLVPALQKLFPFDALQPADYGRVFRHLALVLGASVLATLANPYTWRVYEEALRASLDQYARASITEWMSVNFQSSIGLLIGAFTFLMLWWLLWSRRFHSAWHMLLLPVFLYLGMTSVRNTTLLVIFLLPWLYAALAGHAGLRDFLEKSVDRAFGFRAGNWLYYAYNFTLALAPLALFAFTATTWLNSTLHFDDVAQRIGYPARAVDFLHARGGWQNEVLLNDYNWGGYLIWRLPEYKVYTDGRMASWRGDKHILKEYSRIVDLSPDWLALFKADHITLTLMPSKSRLSNVLHQMPGFRPIYSDDVATIFQYTP